RTSSAYTFVIKERKAIKKGGLGPPLNTLPCAISLLGLSSGCHSWFRWLRLFLAAYLWILPHAGHPASTQGIFETTQQCLRGQPLCLPLLSPIASGPNPSSNRHRL